MNKCIASLLNDGSNVPVWQTMKSVVGNTTEWVLYAPVPTNLQSGVIGVRLVIDNINNGRFYNDYSSYSGVHASPLRAMVYELEAYGP